MPLTLSTTCKTCGHECHCQKKDCDKCINDVCTKCTCDNAVMLGTDATDWKWVDSGVEQGFS